MQRMKKIFIAAILLCCAGLAAACGRGGRGYGELKDEDPKNLKVSAEVVKLNETKPAETTTEEIPEETTEEVTSYWEDPKHSKLLKPGESYTLHCDIDNDGTDEAVILYAADEYDPRSEGFAATRLKITDGDAILFQSDNLTDMLHEDYERMYYMVSRNGKNYLLEFFCLFGMGDDSRQYSLIEFMSDGSMKVVEKVISDLSPGHVNNTTDVDDAVNYREKAMKYLEEKSTVLLFDTNFEYTDIVYSYDGSIKYADARIEKDLFRKTISEDGDFAYAIEWKDKDTFREKVKKYCDYCITRQVKP